MDRKQWQIQCVKIFTEFDRLLRTYSPEASGNAITLAFNAFIRTYGCYHVDPQIILATLLPEEMLRIKHAGKKCQQIYLNAQEYIRAAFDKPVRDILALKEVFYNQARKIQSKRTDIPKSLKEDVMSITGVDRMIIQCIERGMTSKEKFETLIGNMLAQSHIFTWDGDIDVIKKAFCAISKELHPDQANPQTYIVQYIGKDTETIYTGVNPTKGRDEIIRRLKARGYQVSMSGRIEGLPIRYIRAKKIEEETNNA